MRRLAALSALAGAFLAVPAVASAFWAATANGAAVVPAATLAPPTSAEVRWTPAVRVSWTPTTSTWASGYRVSRSLSSTGTFTVVGDVPASSTTFDDNPGAGTHHYRVEAYRDGWSSPVSNVASRIDPTYVVSPTGAFLGTNCGGAGGTRADLVQGYAPATSTTTSVALQNVTVTLCTDTFTSGQSIPAGQTSARLHIENSGGGAKNCVVNIGLSVNGTVSLGSTTHTVLAGRSYTTASMVSWATLGRSFTSGDRVNLTLSAPGNDCKNVALYGGRADAPSSVTLTG